MSELEDALQEIKRLQLENAELKRRLGPQDATIHEGPVDYLPETPLPPPTLQSSPILR